MLGECVVENNVKPEMEIFDGGMLGNANYYIKKGYITGNPHYQFILGVSGGLDGTVENLVFLKNKTSGKCNLELFRNRKMPCSDASGIDRYGSQWRACRFGRQYLL